MDELDIDVDNKSEQELKEIVNHIYVLIYNDQSVTIGKDNEFNNSNIASSIKTQNWKSVKLGIASFDSSV